MCSLARSAGRFVPVVLILVCSIALRAAEGSSSYRAALESITADRLQQHVDYLADDRLEGREAGRRGGRAAGEYLRERLAELDLQGAADGGTFFQHFAPNFRNVLAVLPGSDEQLKDRYVVVSAHYDHVGYGTRRNSRGPVGYIHNGADDNASGASGLLELAEAFTMLPRPPKRSILFAFWDAEEKGMLGSKHWAAQPNVPLADVVAGVDMDMIGRLRDDRLFVFGARSGCGWRRLLSFQNEATALKLEFNWTLKHNSDHYPLFARNIPVLLLHTGKHEAYHTPYDDARHINSEGMSRVVRLVFGVVHELADGGQTPRFRPSARRETEHTRRRWAAMATELPNKPLRLGIMWRIDDAEPGTVILTHVVADSPAARAGLRRGDRIYRIAGGDFPDDRRFAQLARTLAEPLELLVERDGRLRTVVLYIESEPLRRAA